MLHLTRSWCAARRRGRGNASWCRSIPLPGKGAWSTTRAVECSGPEMAAVLPGDRGRESGMVTLCRSCAPVWRVGLVKGPGM